MTDQSPRHGFPFWVEGELVPRLTVNDIVQVADARVGTSVQDRDLNGPPVSPSEGQMWLIAASATGAWTGESGNVAQYFNGAWSFYTPVTGWLLWVDDEDVLILYDGATWITVAFGNSATFGALSDAFALTGNAGKVPVVSAGATVLVAVPRPYVVAGFFPGSPTAGQTVLIHVFTDAVTFPSGLGTSKATTEDEPVAQDDFDIQKNDVTVATMRFPSSTLAATFIASAAFSFSAGDRLLVIAPASTASAGDIAFSLRGTFDAPTS